MKVYRIIAITFFGILVHAFAEDCKLEPATKDFDSEKYFSIRRAYTIYSKNGPKENVCRLYKTTKNPEGTTKTLVFGDYKNGERPRKPLLECTNRQKEGKLGQFDVECTVKVTGTSNTTKIQLETSVLDTDNEKYVILQRCSKTGQGNTDDIVVLQRFKVGLEKGVEDYFDKKGWTFNQWVSREKANCVENKN